MVDTSVLGISVQEGGSSPVLLLFPHNTRSILPIQVGPLEAFAISSALAETDKVPSDEKKEAGSSAGNRAEHSADATELFSRPLMHQLLQKSIDSLGGHLIAVELFRNGEDELTSALVLKGPRGEERLDCRPSDGIALAVRCGATVRVSPAMAAQSQDIESVMPTLSENLRIIVAGRLLSEQGDRALGPIRDALLYSALKTSRGRIRKSMVDISRLIIKKGREGGSIAAALAEAGSKLGLSDEQGNAARSGQRRLPAAKTPGLPVPGPAPEAVVPKTIENDDGSTTVEAIVVPGQTIVLPSPQAGIKAPTIRISLVRQGNEGEPQTLDEVLFPASGIAKEALDGLSLSRDEVKAVGNAPSEDDRLATLLRLLSPETKVPM